MKQEGLDHLDQTEEPTTRVREGVAEVLVATTTTTATATATARKKLEEFEGNNHDGQCRRDENWAQPVLHLGIPKKRLLKQHLVPVWKTTFKESVTKSNKKK
jgi:hypothetical protein